MSNKLDENSKHFFGGDKYPFDDEDLKKLNFYFDNYDKIKTIIEGEERMKWLWSNVRFLVGGASALIVGSWAVFEVVGKFIKKIYE